MTPEQLIKIKTQVQSEVQEWEKKLQEVIQKQKEEKHPEKLVQLILQYDQIEREIEDRTHVFSVLSEPEEVLNSPYLKSEWYSYIEAAETISPELVDSVMTRFASAIRQSITSGEDDTVDLIQAEYKEYLIPGQILAGHFERIDGLVMEMNAAIMKLNPAYDVKESSVAVYYAFQKAIDSNVRIEPIAEAVKSGSVKSVTVDQRNQLLNQLEERAAVLRFEITRKQNVAMDKAVQMLEEREK